MKIYICGDSISASYTPEQAPQAGWGQYLDQFLPGVPVVNKAVGGRSTKSFLSEGRLSEVEALLEEGDIVLIQFAHNDENILLWRYSEPWSAYVNQLSIFIDTARFYGAVPVVLSPICMRVWLGGKLQPTHGEYPAAAQEAARSKNAAFIDMYQESFDLASSLGEEGSKCLFLYLPAGHEHYPAGREDFAHTSTEGAQAFAKIIAQNLIRLGLVTVKEGLL